MTIRPRRVGPVLLLLLLVLAEGCAHRLPRRQAYETSGRRNLYLANLTERQRVGFVTSNLSIWIQRGDQRFPGASADMALLGPDKYRLRIHSSFGTLVDMAMWGDSVTAYVPSLRTGLFLPSARDSLQIERPGSIAYRAFSGAWDPPESAWETGATWTDSLLEITWLERADTLVMGVQGDGLPAWVQLANDDLRVRLDYRSWDRSAGTAWPNWLILDSRSADVRVTVRTAQPRFASRVDVGRLNVRIPEGTSWLTVRELREMLGRLGAMR